jgi:NAD(P)-dependent dehydrogenase (short-subunit alcohol dehydrogenase family)
MSRKRTDFTGKVVVLTGAGGILVSKFAQAYAAAGAKVALLDLNKAAAQEQADLITEAGGTAFAYECNVLKKTSIEAAREAVNNDLGTVDILINGAGGNNPRATTDNEFHEVEGLEGITTFFDLDEEGISFVFNLNFLGTLLPTQVFAKDMIGKDGTNILNISSMNGFTPLTKIPAYSGAKAAISNFTEWLAVHFSHVGIRVNAIAPGFLVSNQNRALLFNDDGEPTARANKILNNTPMNRFGEADELVGGVLYLTSQEEASFVNGVVLPIDGGFNAYSGV